MSGHQGETDKAVLFRNSRGYDRIDKYTLRKQKLGQLKSFMVITNKKWNNGSFGFPGIKSHFLESFYSVMCKVPQVYDAFGFISHNIE